MLLERLFAPSDARKISVEQSTAITELNHKMENMERNHRRDMEAFARVPYAYNGYYSIPFTGEKTMGGIGPVYHLHPEYETLRARSWQAYLHSEIAQTVVNKFVLWGVGSGLRLQCEPKEMVLKSEGIKGFDEPAFEKITEARYNLYANSKMSDSSGMATLNKLASRAMKNAIIGGDVLVIQRYIKGQVRLQLVDGAHVANPTSWPGMTFDNRDACYKLENGNRVSYGVEIAPDGSHVAFYVHKGYNEYERIPAYDKANKQLRAWLVYGLEYRLDNVRGIPLISAVMEKLAKMERFEDATLSGAEARANMPFYIKQHIAGPNENPFLTNDRFVKAMGADPTKLATSFDGEQLARNVSVSLERTVYNMPNGAELHAVDSKQPEQFKDFFTANINLVCATLGIPPNVAMSMYDSNYSASRAAIKEWEHTLNVNRADFARQFYQPNYYMWLDIEIMSLKIPADAYLEAKARNNEMAIEAIRCARFAGARVPHIDPVKEVEAARRKLGDLGANIPLTNVEEAVEDVGGGELGNNIERFYEVLEMMKKITTDTTEKTPPAS